MVELVKYERRTKLSRDLGGIPSGWVTIVNFQIEFAIYERYPSPVISIFLNFLPRLVFQKHWVQNISGEFRLRKPPPYIQIWGNIGGVFLMGKFSPPKMLFFDVSEEYNFLDFFHQIFFSWWFLFDYNKTILKQEQKIHKIDKMMLVIAKNFRLRRAK